MPNFPGGGYGANITAPSSLDVDDVVLMGVDGLVKPVTLSASHGCVDASHFADLAATVLNTAESTTGWTGSALWSGAAVTLDTTYKSTGSASVRGQLSLIDTASKMYVELGSDTAVGNFCFVAIDVFSEDWVLTTGQTFDYCTAHVGTAVALGGTVNTVSAALLGAKTAVWVSNVFRTIYIPLTGLTSIRSIGVGCSVSAGGTSRGYCAIDNVRFAAATGLDQAIHAAGTSGHVVIPPGYTTALTQVPHLQIPAGVTVEDRRAA